jgi:hypothetical protein
MPGYALLASPTLYPGQTVRAGVLADGGNARSVGCRLFLRAYGPGDELLAIDGPGATLAPGEAHEFAWQVADTEGAPVVQLGLELFAAEPADATVYLDYVGWDGAPDVTLTRPRWGGELWRRAWVDGVDQFEARWPEPYRIVQNRGVGLLSQGGADWADYRVSAAITPHLAAAAGVAARVGGMRRYYALTLNDDGTARLVKALDGITVLASRAFPWEFDGIYACELQVSGNRLQGSIDGRPLFDLEDPERPLLRGGVAFLCEEGCLSSDAMRVRPVE